jgi:hypothetical protein
MKLYTFPPSPNARKGNWTQMLSRAEIRTPLNALACVSLVSVG